MEDDPSEMLRVGDHDGLDPQVVWAQDNGAKEGWTCVGDGINHNGRTVQRVMTRRCRQGIEDLAVALMIFLPVGMDSLVYSATMDGPLSSGLKLREQDGIRDGEQSRSQMTTVP